MLLPLPTSHEKPRSLTRLLIVLLCLLSFNCVAQDTEGLEDLGTGPRGYLRFRNALIQNSHIRIFDDLILWDTIEHRFGVDQHFIVLEESVNDYVEAIAGIHPRAAPYEKPTDFPTKPAIAKCFQKRIRTVYSCILEPKTEKFNEIRMILIELDTTDNACVCDLLNGNIWEREYCSYGAVIGDFRQFKYGRVLLTHDKSRMVIIGENRNGIFSVSADTPLNFYKDYLKSNALSCDSCGAR